MPTGQAYEGKTEPRARRRLSQGFEKMIAETKQRFPAPTRASGCGSRLG